jgi:hypothetical protein
LVTFLTNPREAAAKPKTSEYRPFTTESPKNGSPKENGGKRLAGGSRIRPDVIAYQIAKIAQRAGGEYGSRECHHSAPSGVKLLPEEVEHDEEEQG